MGVLSLGARQALRPCGRLERLDPGGPGRHARAELECGESMLRDVAQRDRGGSLSGLGEADAAQEEPARYGWSASRSSPSLLVAHVQAGRVWLGS